MNNFGIMKPEHKKWADLVVSGVSELQAYLNVYPNASKKTASNQLGNFRQNLGLMGYIHDKTHKIAEKVEAKTLEKLSEVAIGNVLTSAKKREILNLIASGELEYEKMVLVMDPESKKMVWRKMLVKPDLHERMKAMDIDNKMTGETFRSKPHELGGDTAKEELDDLFKNTTFVFKGKD